MGAVDLIKKVPYSWWPPKNLLNQNLGIFDLYPNEYSSWSRDAIISHVEKTMVVRQSDFKQLSMGCFHLKSFLGGSGQQGFIDAIREMCLDNPAKMRFQSTSKLVKETQDQDADQYLSDKKKEMAIRNTKKYGCYVLNVNHRDMSLHEIKMLGCSIEEGVNEAVKRSWDEGNSFGLISGQQNFKAQYQRYIFDFYKEGNSSNDGGYTEKIDLSDIGKSGNHKKNKL